MSVKIILDFYSTWKTEGFYQEGIFINRCLKSFINFTRITKGLAIDPELGTTFWMQNISFS
ncbi:hypothetical protein CS542_01600 [Pedobacter sp. IW39]|nr:hypothetical protein CS542_01600 [Pedobacter sp. IW39]